MQDLKEQIEASVKERFARIAVQPSVEVKFPVGALSAKRLGYSQREIDSLPPFGSESFAGVGNPFALGTLYPGDRVLDLGCGAGFDSLIAAALVGESGSVIGIDFTCEMITKAESNARLVGAMNTDFRIASAERLPLRSGSVDVILTNGVFNLCVNKPAVVQEMSRVLTSGGRLQMADILLEPHITPAEAATKGEWSD